MRRYAAFLAGAIVAIYFLVLTRDAWHAYFTQDDCANLHQALYFPLSSLLKGCVLWFQRASYARPLGGMWYRSIYAVAGFNPLPFHLVNLAILLANAWLTYGLSWRLSASRETGVLAALLVSYHPRFSLLYYDTGFIFDVLCYFFYFSALLLYVRVRQQGRPLNALELAGVAALYLCALDSKELAITLPLFLIIYELLYEERRSFRAVAVTSVLAAIFVVERIADPNSLLSIPEYRPVFTWARLMITSRAFINPLFFQESAFTSLAVVLIWLVLFAVAWGTGSRALKFAWLFLMLSPAPIAFIEPRGPAQYYIPFFGWVLYAAVGLVAVSKILFRARLETARAMALFGVLTLLLYFSYRGTGWASASFVSLEGEMLRSLSDQMHRAHPTVRHGARLLFVNDPIRPNTFDMMFLTRLAYGDTSLVVDRVQAQQTPDAKLLAAYDYVFDYRLGRFFTTIQSQAVGPAIVFEWGQLGVFHRDWVRVTAQKPAKAGEVLIAMVSDLGDTKPAIPRGQAFPKEPLLDVAGPVEVRVAGEPVEIVLKIGWPEQVNRYRVDFRVPVKVGRGEIGVVISAGGVAGPEVGVPVN